MAHSPILAKILVLGVLTCCHSYGAKSSHIGDGRSSHCYDDATTVHGFSPNNISGQAIQLDEFEGKVVLILNVASFCDFTPQYHGLTAVKGMKEFKDRLEILAFPSNQFHYQEPGENEYEIMNSLRYCRPGYGYEPNFPMFEKIDVNGEDEIELFTHLKASCPPAKLEIGDKGDRFWNPFRNNDITWNFNKFLVDREGVPYKRYDSAVEPEDLVGDIRTLIGKTGAKKQ